jgi:glycosyltransferase involved in cell wall biosynthesis
MRIKIIFFIGSLRAGGKERRLVELLSYLSSRGLYELLVIMTSHHIHYEKFHELNIRYHVIPKMWNRNDVSVFYKFYRIVQQYQPDIIHSWGKMQTLYCIPTVIKTKLPLINSQITGAPPSINKISLDYLIDRVNFKYSKTVLSNSKAGIEAFRPPLHKSRVIHNGVNLERFEELPDVAAVKEKYNILTPYTVVMVASVSPNKNYRLFFDIAQVITKIRSDISFIGVGWYIEDDPDYQDIKELTCNNGRLLFPGNINDVEALVNACDIGVLFSPNGEGISNAIIEYMSLGKPVIASRIGGNTELIQHNENGYLVKESSADEIAELVIELIDNKDKRDEFGKKSKEIILHSFSLERMGEKFEATYRDALGLSSPKLANVKASN